MVESPVRHAAETSNRPAAGGRLAFAVAQRVRHAAETSNMPSVMGVFFTM